MSYFCYILYSPSINKYYIGETDNLQRRIEWHNNHQFLDVYTVKASDWGLFYSIECNSRSQARKIESHIKKMKSRKYLLNLKIYPRITERLLTRYQD